MTNNWGVIIGMNNQMPLVEEPGWQFWGDISPTMMKRMAAGEALADSTCAEVVERQLKMQRGRASASST